MRELFAARNVLSAAFLIFAIRVTSIVFAALSLLFLGSLDLTHRLPLVRSPATIRRFPLVLVEVSNRICCRQLVAPDLPTPRPQRNRVGRVLFNPPSRMERRVKGNPPYGLLFGYLAAERATCL